MPMQDRKQKLLTTAQLSIEVERVETAAKECGVTPKQMVKGWAFRKLSPAQKEVVEAILDKYPDPESGEDP